MHLIFKLCLAVSIFSSLALNAAVWEDNQAWSLQYEEEFSSWMQSNAVNEQMFTDPKSKYFGVSTDCADTSYAFRAIFAFEHNLPFAIYSPSGSRGSNKSINNRQSNWDRAGTNTKRLIAMINEIGDSVGTENLAHFDTFPVAIKSINPGSIFMYKINARFGKFIRHAYNIKAINPVGTFDVIYSTQANKAKGLPLIRRKDKEFENNPSSPWGFRKFRWPDHLGKNLSSIPLELGPSDEQFSLALTLGPAAFFKMVRKTLSTTNETISQRMTRSFKSTCTEAQARIDYVNQGLLRIAETNNKCMNYEEFDAYSTPARDQSLKELFEKFQLAYADMINEGAINSIDPRILEFAEIIFKNKSVAHSDLLMSCPIAYRPGVSIDLATLWKRIDQGLLSSHPNDTVELRWGETSRKATKCKRWY